MTVTETWRPTSDVGCTVTNDSDSDQGNSLTRFASVSYTPRTHIHAKELCSVSLGLTLGIGRLG